MNNADLMQSLTTECGMFIAAQSSQQLTE